MRGRAARGAIPVAVTAMRRAAELGEPASRSRRLLAAAGLAVELGRRDVVVAAAAARSSTLDLGDAGPRAGHLGRGDRDDAPARRRAVRLADRRSGAGRSGRRPRPARRSPLARRLARVVGRSRSRGETGADRRRPPAGRCRTPTTRACSRSTRTPIRWATRPACWSACEGRGRRCELDTDAARFFGPAALVVGAFDLGNDFLAAAVDGLRTEGRLGHLPRLLTLHSSMAARIGDWDVAITAADEARRLAEEFAEPQWAAAADTAIALVAAMRGDERDGRVHGRASRDGRGAGRARTSRWRSPSSARCWRRSPPVATPTRTHRAKRLFDPGDSAYHPVISSWLIGDLADAARHIDRARRRARPGRAGRGERRRAPRHLDRAGAPSRPRAGRGRRRGGRALRRGALERPRPGGRSSAPGSSSPTASGCGASGESPSPGAPCARRATPSTRSAARRGASRRDASCARQASAAGAACPRLAIS